MKKIQKSVDKRENVCYNAEVKEAEHLVLTVPLREYGSIFGLLKGRLVCTRGVCFSVFFYYFLEVNPD